MKPAAWSIALLTTLGACASSPPSQFYTLSASDGPAATSVTGARYAVLVGPVTVPELVDRPQFVLRLGENRVSIVEQARWAEPLASAIPARIAGELARLLGSNRIMVYPQSPESFDCQVVIEVLRFDSVLDDAATLEVAWTLRGAGAPGFGRALVHEQVDGKGYGALVAAHSRALRAVSAAIAEAIRRRDDSRVARS